MACELCEQEIDHGGMRVIECKQMFEAAMKRKGRIRIRVLKLNFK